MTLPPPPTSTTTTTLTSSTKQQEYDRQRQELARCNVLITIIAMYFEQGGERVMQVAKHT
jgi:acetoacetate decarboxylase